MVPGLTPLSNRYRTTWNGTAADLGISIRIADKPGNMGMHGKIASDTLLHTTPEQPGQDTFHPSSPATISDIVRVSCELELRRANAVHKSWAANKLYKTEVDTSHLTAAELEFIRRIKETLPLLKELDILLKDERGLEQKAYLDENGDTTSAGLFDRISHNAIDPALRRDPFDTTFFSTLDYFPDLKFTFGSVMPTSLIPADLTKEEFVAMSAAIQKAAVDPMYNAHLSPFTSLVRDESEPTGWRAVKLNKDPRFADRIAALAQIIQHAAETPDLDTSLRAQMLATVDNLTNDDFFSQYKEDEAWVAQKTGNLEVNVGITGGYSPLGKANGAGLFIGVEKPDGKEVAFLHEHLGPLMQEMEDDFANLIGHDIYQPRALSTDTAVRVVDALIMSAASFRPTLAFVGPDSGPANFEGRVKRVMIINHHAAKATELLFPIAQIALDPALLPFVSAEYFLRDAEAHEYTHPTGPRTDQTIEVKGVNVRLIDALANEEGSNYYYNSIEESKANISGLLILAKARDKGDTEVNAEAVKKAYITFVMSLIRQMRQGRTAHGGGARAEMTWLMNYKIGGRTAVRIEQIDVGGTMEPRITVDLEVMDDSLKALWGYLGRMQKTANVAEAINYLFTQPDANLPEAFDAITDRIKAAGIPIDLKMIYPDLDKLFR